MRYFTFVQPQGEASAPEYVTMSEDEIRKEYYPYWYGKMCEKYEQSYVDEHYCFEDCLEDWKIIHWAREAKE
jgi:hypothetical protein